VISSCILSFTVAIYITLSTPDSVFFHIHISVVHFVIDQTDDIMAPEKNLSLIFKKVPSSFPVAGEHLTVEDRGFDPSASPSAGGVTTQNIYASLDPYLRGRMREAESKSYFPPFTLNEPLVSINVCRILKSDNPKYKEGDLIVGGQLPVQQYSTLSSELIENAKKIDPSTALKDLRNYIGPLGMPGLTAYSSLYEIGKPKKGEAIFISSAAGAVGQLVGQLAKHEGLTVIGSVGTEEKLKFITEDLGFDGGFNYKKEKPLEALRRLAPDGIDIYYENVGGEQLEAALEMMKTNGRIVCSGMISQYNLPENERYGVKTLTNMIGKMLTFRGFLVGSPDFGPKWTREHEENVGKWIAEGTFKATFSETDGIEEAPEGLVGMLNGENFGKAVLKI
jgi:NADPH-dependent curcumin reductase CurA